jgi:hypothetical protein
LERADALALGVALLDRAGLALGFGTFFTESELDGLVVGEPVGETAARIDANATIKMKRVTNTKVSRNAFDLLSHQIPTEPRLVGGGDELAVCANECVP